MALTTALVLCYFLGSFPTALIAGKILGGVDIRTTGSGNAGATNLYRLFGLKPYMAVLMLDMAKGFISSKWVSQIGLGGTLDGLELGTLCGVVAVLGHVFSVFASFKGGKGVATAAGVMLAVAPGPLLAAIGVYLVVISITHYVSLGSISAALSVPAWLATSRIAFGAEIRWEVYSLSVLLAVMIIATHRANIKRLIKGEELKTRFFNKD
ncbi:MAG: glycerol-3-phosphate 1-O-acyltransferase PlsY [Nitrospinae bacterium]|nr:glycerol-3-phosphate 1-O-acyltransferase PlsY [Nitrospinota bacterium]